MPAGRDSESTPMVTQVERRSSARRNVLDGTRRSPVLVWTTISFALPRPEPCARRSRPGAGRASPPSAPAARPAPAVMRETLSSGSGTEMRYGIGVPPMKTSSTSAVRPPDDEEEERRRHLAVEHQHLASWRRRPCRRRPTRPRPRRTPGSACRRRGSTARRLGERVRARGDGLRLHDLERPVVRHLLAYDTTDVGVDADDVDDLQPAVARAGAGGSRDTACSPSSSGSDPCRNVNGPGSACGGNCVIDCHLEARPLSSSSPARARGSRRAVHDAEGRPSRP